MVIVAGKAVQVRPILGAEDNRTHDWSKVVGSSNEPIQLDMLKDAVAQLRSCAALPTSIEKGVNSSRLANLVNKATPCFGYCHF